MFCVFVVVVGRNNCSNLFSTVTFLSFLGACGKGKGLGKPASESGLICDPLIFDVDLWASTQWCLHTYAQFYLKE